MDRFEIPLDIEDVKIERVEFTQDNEIIITVTSTLEGTNCHRCGKKITAAYGYGREITLRHLSILGKPTYLRIKPKRYQCAYCGDHPTTTQTLSWYEARRPHTKAYETHILLSLVNSTVADVSSKEGLGYEAVEGIIDRWVSEKVEWNEFKELEQIGLDEIAPKKGHQDFFTIITARLATGAIRVLGVLEGREKATVKKFFLSIPKALRKAIRVVCSDLYEGYINAVKEVLGKRGQVVVDRFHVAKLYRKGLDELRKKELKRLKKELPETDYQVFKGVMWLLRKNPVEIKPEELEVLSGLFKHTPLLGSAYVFCYTLTSIFELPLSKAEAKQRLGAWKQLVQASEVDCFDSFLSTLDKRLEEITNYFVDRKNSGFVEGLNNKIKVIKRRCYGIFKVGHLFQRLFIDLTGYEKFA
ncbi:MAG TPA: ISL3 family transposase [Saprospiraceae bacterium]|nr:ISL3 family transposase [Saprospiraceae bacterium]